MNLLRASAIRLTSAFDGPVQQPREDALLRWERLRQQSVEPPKPESPKSQSRRAEMDPATSARWNEWLHAGISARLSERINDFAEISGEFVAERENAIRDDHKRELAALRLELDGLRVEIARLKHDDDAKVIDLPALPRRAA